MPKKNSKPISILANHSANVQLRKVVSTIVQPNCSNVGILEIAEKINIAPMVMLKTENIIFLKSGFKWNIISNKYNNLPLMFIHSNQKNQQELLVTHHFQIFLFAH